MIVLCGIPIHTQIQYPVLVSSITLVNFLLIKALSGIGALSVPVTDPAPIEYEVVIENPDLVGVNEIAHAIAAEAGIDDCP